MRAWNAAACFTYGSWMTFWCSRRPAPSCAVRFGAAVLKLAQATIEKFVEQATRLYEQGRRERRKAPLLGRYVRRWLGWANGGMTEAGEGVWRAADQRNSHTPGAEAFPKQSPQLGDAPVRANSRYIDALDGRVIRNEGGVSGG